MNGPGIIYYLTVGAPTSGGQQVNEEHVQALCEMGWDARLLQWPRQNDAQPWPTWHTACRLDRMSSPEVLRPQDIIVLPEAWRPQIKVFAGLKVRKVVHNQNPYYCFRGADHMSDLMKQGYEHILTCSDYTSMLLRQFGWTGPLHTVVPQIDPVFTPRAAPLLEQPLRIALMPRKRPVEAMFMQGLFRARYPQWAQVPWLSINEMTRQQCAEVLQQSAVFASFSHLEGLGLPPLEAAACGCIVAGFTGGGGRDYATPSNGFWVAEGDHDAFAQALDTALRCASTPVWRAEVQGAFQASVTAHGREAFKASLAQAWTAIAGQPAT